MMSDFENKNVIFGNENTNSIERELSDVIGNSENHCDIESNAQFTGNHSQETDFSNMAMEVQFQDRIDSRKQWKLLLVHLALDLLRRWTL